MFDQIKFGKKLKSLRTMKKLTQDEIATRIGISTQAVSKWEKGENLPDVWNLRLLSKVFRVSIDDLLDMDDEKSEKIIEIIKIGQATFDIVEKAETILAGRIIYANDFSNIKDFHSAIGCINDNENKKNKIFGMVADCIMPICDIHLSVNFWLNESTRAFGFVREVKTENQPKGVDIYKMPSSLFIRAYTDYSMAQLIAKEQCDIWELFAYIRNFFMPAHGFTMATSGAQELEVFDTSEHKTGYAYMPVLRNKNTER